MDVIVKKIEELIPADYNPRKDLTPEDTEYQKLKRSIEEFGYIEPIVWNEKTGNIVGGHQRLKVLKEQGAKETECVKVNLDEHDEKILNIQLNRIKGRWDIFKLTDLLSELAEAGAAEITGFEKWEIDSLLQQYEHISDLLSEDFSGYETETARDAFTMTFSLPGGAKDKVEEYINRGENAKEKLSVLVLNRAMGIE